MGIDEQGNAYINAKEEDLATFSILDNPYSLYWGSSSETGDTSYSYKPVTAALNVTKGAVVEPLELKKLHKISYILYNYRTEECDYYTLDVTVKGFDTPIRIITMCSGFAYLDVSNSFENYLCIDIDNFQPFKLYLSHKDDEAQASIDFDISSVSNFEQNQHFYFDCSSLLWAEPFTTANFDKYLEYYKGEPVFNEIYRKLHSGFNGNDIKNITQVIPDYADDSQYVQTYELDQRAHIGNNIVKKFSKLNKIDFSFGDDFSDTTIYLPDNQTVSINIEQSDIIPPYYENVANVEGINLSIFNDNPIIDSFRFRPIYQDDDVLSIQIQQTASDYSNDLATKIHNLRISSENLSFIQGELREIESLTLAIQNELPAFFELKEFIPSSSLKLLDLSNSKFKDIPDTFCNTNYHLETLILSDTIENIGSRAFDLTYLKEIVISKNLKQIGNSGFNHIGDNGDITSLDFRDTKLETLELDSLHSYASLKIYLPTTVKNIEKGAFGKYTTVYYKGTATGAPWGAKEVITEF